MKNLEIAWREELLKRLEAPKNTLKRKLEKELIEQEARLVKLRQYSSLEEAHDAYGYGEITLDEYDLISQDFNNLENIQTPVSLALDELISIMGRLKKDIDYLKWEALSDAEKQAIEDKNEAYKRELQERRCNIG